MQGIGENHKLRGSETKRRDHEGGKSENENNGQISKILWQEPYFGCIAIDQGGTEKKDKEHAVDSKHQCGRSRRGEKFFISLLFFLSAGERYLRGEGRNSTSGKSLGGGTGLKGRYHYW